MGTQKPEKKIRVATFNAALFSMAPALPTTTTAFEDENNVVGKTNTFDINSRSKSTNDRPPKSILKQTQSQKNINLVQLTKSKTRVSINLPDNEISMLRSRQSSFSEHEKERASTSGVHIHHSHHVKSGRTLVEVLREVDADILGLQDVKAEEENGMKPLSDLAAALGMNYVFAESWAPEYGNAVFSKWPIKRWNVDKIFDHTDFRLVSSLFTHSHFQDIYYFRQFVQKKKNYFGQSCDTVVDQAVKVTNHNVTEHFPSNHMYFDTKYLLLL